MIKIYHENFEIIIFNVFLKQFEGLRFRFWRYAIIKEFVVVIQKDDNVKFNKFTKNDIISNFDCIMSVIDRKFLASQISNAIIKRIAQIIKIWDINDAMISSSEYIMLKIIVSDILKKRSIIDKF